MARQNRKSFLVFTACLGIWIPTLADSFLTANSSSNSRQAKVLSLFQVIQFQNGPCGNGGIRNGTCYTQSECDNRGGTSMGTCAGGFGICCSFILACGGISSDNCSYLVQTSTSIAINPCKFTICPLNNDICRLRFDFMIFNINGPVTASAIADVNMNADTTLGGAIGDCLTDTFSISAPRNFAPPVICGFNSGQHMIVDTSPGNCNEANFVLRGAGTRNWDIKGKHLLFKINPAIH